MNFFADENVEREIVDWLRDEGHDVLWAAESFDGDPDEKILGTALLEKRIIITSDLDFGEHLFRLDQAAHGLLQMRFHRRTANERLAMLQRYWPVILPNLQGSFIVVTEKRVRRRTLPR